MKRARDAVLIIFLFLMTFAYAFFIDSAMTFYDTLLKNSGLTALSNFTVVTAGKPGLWQVLAFAFLLVNLAIACLPAIRKRESCALTTVAAMQTVWLLGCFFVHGLGFLLPFVLKTHVI